MGAKQFAVENGMVLLFDGTKKPSYSSVFRLEFSMDLVYLSMMKINLLHSPNGFFHILTLFCELLYLIKH